VEKSGHSTPLTAKPFIFLKGNHGKNLIAKAKAQKPKEKSDKNRKTGQAALSKNL